MRAVIAVLLILAPLAPVSQPATPPPVIDMHVHAMGMEFFTRLGGSPPIPHCVPMTAYPVPESGRGWPSIMRSRDLPCRSIWSPATAADVMRRSLDIMARRNVFGVASGPRIDAWTAAAPDRIIPSLAFSGGPDAPSVEAMAALFKEQRFAVLGEVTAQYGGLAPDDPSLEPYWAMAESLDIPVGIHIGTGPVGAPYLGFDRYRARLHSPLALEDVLIRHPDLRVYIMHAAWPMLDDLLALLWTHPQVHMDVGVIDWALPRPEFHRYLRRIVEAGFGKRVMFGSDQMIWPDALDIALESVESADFLSPEQRRDILFDNAARFLRLPPERIARMHGRASRSLRR